jgi:broad-specificity NMP kinase
LGFNHSNFFSRNYSFEKIFDNVFCEGIEYCKKHINRHYSTGKIAVVKSQTNFSDTVKEIISVLEKKKN